MIFVTVSYRGDLARLRLLRDSMDVFYRGDAKHIIIVPRDDFDLFKSYANHPGIEVLVQNDLVNPAFYPRAWHKYAVKLLGNRSWRIARYAGRSGWIVQQIVKLSLPAVTQEKDIVVIDSDVVFTRQFIDSDFVPNNKMHILVRVDPGEESARHRKHMNSARHLLKLPEGSTDHHYMSCPVVLNRDWLISLQNYIEKLYGSPWQTVLCGADLFSEYCIYGVYVEEILKPRDLILREQPYNLGVWAEKDFFEILDRMLDEGSNSSDYLCLTIQSNLGVSAEEYEGRVTQFLKQSLD